MRMPAILLLSLAGVVLLIACLNLANMMMAQGAARRKEIAIRLAIGGGRQRIVQQLVTERLILAIIGGAAGLVIASWSTTLFISSLARLAPLDLVYDAKPDARVLIVTLAFCVASTVIFALFPAWKLSKPDVWLDLKENIGEDLVGRTGRVFSRGNILVMAQLSLSLMMLTAAGLFIQSAVHAANLQPGFSLEGEIVAEVDASLINYDESHARQLYGVLRDRLRQLRGVQSVAMAATVPFGGTHLAKNIRPPDALVSKDNPPIFARFNIVTEDYFQTLGIPMLRGRPFVSAEGMAGSKNHVVIIDKLAAGKLWPGDNALGKHIRLEDGRDAGQTEICEVVGLVGNVRESILGGRIDSHVYIPFGQQYQADMQIHVKIAGGESETDTRMLGTIRREIRATDERLPLLALRTIRGHVESGLDIWVVRTGAHVLEIFGVVALFLAVVGLYAVCAYTVARRTREIGIRIAIGADPSSMLRMILGEGVRVTAVAVGAGLLLATGLGQVLAAFLYDVRGTDPVVLLAAPVMLTLAALIACYLPAS